MSLHVWLSFALLAVVVVLTPGPAVLMAVSHGSRYGLKRALMPILGNVTGLAIMTSLTAFGLSAVVQTSSSLFLAVRIAGGIYLIYLGVKLLRAKAQPMMEAVSGGIPTHIPSRRHGYVQGIAVALSNPKAILFIGALFPQFIDTTQPVWEQFFILGGTLMAMSFSILCVYAALSSQLVAKGRMALAGKINKVTGVLFIVFGVALAVGRR